MKQKISLKRIALGVLVGKTMLLTSVFGVSVLMQVDITAVSHVADLSQAETYASGYKIFQSLKEFVFQCLQSFLIG